ncbi:unnamed protein product [Urochloa humidicola]
MNRATSRTSLFLRNGCRAPPARSTSNSNSNCTAPSDVMTRVFRTAQCGGAAGGNGSDDWTCVSSTPPDPGSIAAIRGQGQFMMLEDVVDAAGCEDVLTAAVYGYAAAGVPSLEFGVAELGWWVNGSCQDDALPDGYYCAKYAMCFDVETPSGAWGHRCMCRHGTSGGDGYVGARRRVLLRSPPEAWQKSTGGGRRRVGRRFAHHRSLGCFLPLQAETAEEELHGQDVGDEKKST